MKILWITNLPLPAAEDYLFHTLQAKEGWLVQLSQKLASHPEIKLFVASRTLQLKEEKAFIIDGIHYYCFPSKYADNDKMMMSYWYRVYRQVGPDLVHIQGTESAHSSAFIKACPNANTVVSIQGLTSVITRYYFGGIPIAELTCLTTIFNRIIGNTITKKYLQLKKQGEREIFILKNCKYVIGRTEWDKTHVKTINPSIHYFVGNETMRPSFYNNRWSIDRCTQHSIFVTQGLVPYKGLHQMLNALVLVQKVFPDVKLRIALAPINLSTLSWKSRVKMQEYPQFLHNLIQKHKLKDHIQILGSLSEKEMVDTLLSCNVFVSPSCIENSPNSLCEAQLLGVPTVASYVGGTPTIAADGKATELYRFEEHEMLAAKIIRIFQDGPNYKLIDFARSMALVRHDAQNNLNELIDIYHTIIR